MSTEYRPSVLIADGRFIAIKHIESFGTQPTEEQQCVDKLKDDITFSITTISGEDYEISVNKQIDVFSHLGVPDTAYLTYQAILEKWISYNKD